jgi:hypothetical protein
VLILGLLHLFIVRIDGSSNSSSGGHHAVLDFHPVVLDRAGGGAGDDFHRSGLVLRFDERLLRQRLLRQGLL